MFFFLTVLSWPISKVFDAIYNSDIVCYNLARQRNLLGHGRFVRVWRERYRGLSINSIPLALLNKLSVPCRE
jgi:hypothetical protein